MYYYIIQIIFAFYIADFLIGLTHWFKDSYLSPHTPFLGKYFIWGSRLHHYRPRYLVECPNHKIFLESGLWTLLWMIPVFYIFFNLFTIMLFFFLSINDILHKYAHTIDNETPKFFVLLQKSRIIQNYEHHNQHHNEPYNSNYCAMSPVLNPILEKIGLWKYLENNIEKYFGVRARDNIPDYVYDNKLPGKLKFI